MTMNDFNPGHLGPIERRIIEKYGDLPTAQIYAAAERRMGVVDYAVKVRKQQTGERWNTDLLRKEAAILCDLALCDLADLTMFLNDAMPECPQYIVDDWKNTIWIFMEQNNLLE